MNSTSRTPRYDRAFEERWRQLPPEIQMLLDYDIILVLRGSCPSTVICKESGIQEAKGNWFVIYWAYDDNSDDIFFLDCAPKPPEAPPPSAKEVGHKSGASMSNRMARLMYLNYINLPRSIMWNSAFFISISGVKSRNLEEMRCLHFGDQLGCHVSFGSKCDGLLSVDQVSLSGGGSATDPAGGWAKFSGSVEMVFEAVFDARYRANADNKLASRSGHTPAETVPLDRRKCGRVADMTGLSTKEGGIYVRGLHDTFMGGAGSGKSSTVAMLQIIALALGTDPRLVIALGIRKELGWYTAEGRTRGRVADLAGFSDDHAGVIGDGLATSSGGGWANVGNVCKGDLISRAEHTPAKAVPLGRRTCGRVADLAGHLRHGGRIKPNGSDARRTQPFDVGVACSLSTVAPTLWAGAS